MPTAPSPGRAAIMLAAAALLTGTVAVPQAGVAAPLADASAARALATGLGDDRTGGVYVDETGRLVDAVTASVGVLRR